MIQNAATELMLQHRRFVVTQVVLVLLVTLLSPGTGRSTGAEPLPPALLPPVSAQAGIDDVTYSGCGGQTAPVVNAAYEQELVERVNSVRASYSLPPLKRADPLDDAARYHATDLGQDNYFAHDSYDRSGGALVLACGWSARITTYYPAWRANVSATGLHRGRTTQAVNTQPQMTMNQRRKSWICRGRSSENLSGHFS